MRYCKLLVIAVFLMSWGCASLTGSTTEDPGPAPTQNSFYYDFTDIRVPEEMELQPKKSSIVPTETGKFGTIVFKGQAEPISLFDFFFNTMPKDGWTLVTYQKYQRYNLVFTKENKVCMITIEEAPVLYTWLEIKVSPKSPVGAAPAYSTGMQPADSYPSYPSTGSTPEPERTLSE
jgi:hypothetical protein